jgi:GTP-binding protein EngB required for normal cell division
MSLPSTATTPGGPPARSIPDWARASGGSNLATCLTRLDEVIEFAAALGIPVADATGVRDHVLARMGFPADVYTLALVGGTGVGKSSLLNTLAGSAVSPVSVRRPTTDRPVAWVPAASRGELVGLLEHLDVRDIQVHADEALKSVAVLDLPDMDSVAGEHRDRVESLLPRVDAVLWVTDLEKYHDAVLHDAFLARWIDKLDRQLVVLNKADRLAVSDAERVRRDLQLDLDRLVHGRGPGPGVILASATTDGRSGPGVSAIRGWLVQGVEAKAIVRARLSAAIMDAVTALASAGGADPEHDVPPLLAASARPATLDAVTATIVRVVDLPGARQQGIAATRLAARSRGGGPLGRAWSLVNRLTGRQARVADPAAYLARWRERGTLSPALEAIREAVAEPIRRAPPAVRPALSGTVEPTRLGAGLGAAVDRAIAHHGETAPSSRLWPVLGFLQTLATLAVLAAAGWLIVWVAVRFVVDEVSVPILGRLPVPLVLLLVALLASFVVGRLLWLHAGWLGRRWTGRLARDLRKEIADEVAETAFAPLDWVETVQRELWTAARSARDDCRERSRG